MAKHDDSRLKCSFCGKTQDQVKKLIAGPEVYICDECVELCNEILDEEFFEGKEKESATKEKGSSSKEKAIPKPHEIKAYLDEHIVGQDDAKKVLAVSVYNHYKRLRHNKEEGKDKDTVEIQKSNILLVGPTGSGKTLLAQTLAKLLDVPFAVADATTLTEAGYVGDDVENILLRLYQNAEFDAKKAETGIIYIDEIDKIAQRGGDGGGRGEVSREGVQRDILPIVEGTKVSTKWGAIDTTNILFIAAGAFSLSKPSDLIPELQGRFPIRVELNDLSADDFYRILTEPSNAITMQYKALIKTEGVDLEFTEGGLRRIAELAHEVNQTNENIGARRLHTIMEKLLEDVSFSADQIVGQTVTITPEYVDERLKDIAQSQDLSRYIL